MGAVAQQRHALLGQMGEGQFAQRALRQRFACVGVKDLRIEIVFIQVGAVLIFALVAHTRTGNLRKTVDVVGLDA